MGKLDGALGYLSGSMENVDDNGVGWRREIIDLINKSNLKIDLIDPTNKPGDESFKIGEEKDFQIKMQREGKFKKLQKYVSSYRRFDLRAVDYSDFLITSINLNVPQWGTGNEVTLAELQHKPNFFICEGSLFNLPRWLFDVIDKIDADNAQDAMRQCNVFNSIEEVVEELIRLDSGTKPLSDKWILIRNHIENCRSSI